MPAANISRLLTRTAPLLALSPLLLSLLGSDVVSAVDWAVIGAGLAGAYCALQLLRVGFPPVRRLVWAAAAFLGWAAVSAALSDRGWSAMMGEPSSMLGVLPLAALAAVAVWAASLGKEAKTFVIHSAVVITGVQVAFALPQLLGRQHVRGLMPNSTYLGELFVLLVPFLLIARGPRWRVAGLTLAPVSGILLAAAGSRVAAALVLVLLLAVWAKSVTKTAFKAWAIRAALLATAAVSALIFSRGEFLGVLRSAALGDRPLLWETAARATLARPLAGYGPDGFFAGGASVLRLEQLERGQHLAFGPGALDPHNILLWTAVSCGVVGLALLLWVVVGFVVQWRSVNPDSMAEAARWGVGMSLAVYLTAPAAMQVLPLFALLAGLSLGGRVGSGRRPEPGSEAPSPLYVGERVLAVLLLSASLLTVASAGTRLVFEGPAPDLSPPVARASMSAAAAWSIDPYLWHTASMHAGWALREGAAGVEPLADLEAARKASRLDSRNPLYALEVARTLIFYGAKPDEIEEAFCEVFRRWPAFPLARAERALWLARSGRTEEAERELGSVLGVASKDPDVALAVQAAESALRE